MFTKFERTTKALNDLHEENMLSPSILGCVHRKIRAYEVSSKDCNYFVIALYIGLCSQQYLLLFFFLFYHFSQKKQAFLSKKWGSRFSCHFKKSSIYACFRIYLYFFTTLLSVDPLFHKINFYPISQATTVMIQI